MQDHAALETEHTCGRLHLPVAPRCNIQCKYCDRNFDCPNQSRPGVTSEVLTPSQAAAFLDEVLALKPEITAVGVAGPGDALADADATLETLRLVGEAHPELHRFVATNGLKLEEHVQAMRDAGIRTVHVAVNAVDPAIASQIYSFVRPAKRNLFGEEASTTLIAAQEAGIKAAKAADLEVIATCTVIPEVNTGHIADLAAWLAAQDVDGLDLVPFHPAQASILGQHTAASKDDMLAARDAAKSHLLLMECCARCRADAAGLLGNEKAAEIINKVKALGSQSGPYIMPDAQRPYVAVATSNGELIDTHLGHARRLLVYQNDHGLVTMKETREAPPKGGGDDRWKSLGEVLADCKILMVASAGDNPQRVLQESGITVRVVPDDTDVVPAVLAAFGIKNKGKK